MANELNTIVSEGIKDGEVKTADIADQAVDLTKLPHGDGTSDGKFLRSNNGADPTWVAVTSTPEGTAIKSTGESGGTKFLREDGDGTASWQTVSAGTALTGSTNNTITTVTGANAIQGEAELTFDGAHLQQTITASNEGIKLTAAGAHYPALAFDANRTSENHAIAWIDGKWNGTSVAGISIEAGDDTTNKDDGKITFYTTAAGTQTRKMAIEQDGDVIIDDGDLVIGTAGHGIDFSAASDSASGETVSSSLLDDYEEGTFTTGMVSSNLTLDDSSASSGHYVKIGRIVHACGVLSLNTNDGSPSVSGSDNITQSLPFAPRSTTAAMSGTVFQQNINAGPGTSVSHPHYYNIFPCDYICYPASDGVRFYINKIEYAYERITNSHMSAGYPGYTWMSWSITYQTSQ